MNALYLYSMKAEVELLLDQYHQRLKTIKTIIDELPHKDERDLNYIRYVTKMYQYKTIITELTGIVAKYKMEEI